MQRHDAAGHGREGNPLKARLTHHAGEGFRCRKAADRFHKITIRLGVARDEFSDLGDDAEGLELVQRVEARHLLGREFETEKMPARLQHPVNLRERKFDPRHVADAEGDRSGIEGFIGK